ncbi:MAG: hypothetical protein IJ841_00955 [Prevotella sp.]|nr:hypothetical protein [Prevotella sp.]
METIRIIRKFSAQPAVPDFSFSLPSGIFVVKASTSQCQSVKKVVVE